MSCKSSASKGVWATREPEWKGHEGLDTRQWRLEEVDSDGEHLFSENIVENEMFPLKKTYVMGA